MARKSSSRKHSPTRATPRSSHGYAEGDTGRRTGSAKWNVSSSAPKAAGPLAGAPEGAEAISKDVQPSVRDVTGERCGRVLVGRGDDTYDPICQLPKGHTDLCSSGEGDG